MNVLDLFSGIGGFSLGLERSGMRTVAFCEVDSYCRRVLASHWPAVPIYDDVRTLSAARLRADGISINAICGGFPCQDISGAGRKAGIDGERSGLWAEFARLIDELRPDIVLVENVADLLIRGIDRVLGDLAALGYAAEWHCIPACAVGAPHERDRVWIVAYTHEWIRAYWRSPSLRRWIEGAGKSQSAGLAAYSPSVGRRPRRARGSNSGAARQQEEQQPQTLADTPPLLRPALIWEQQDRAIREHWTTDWQSYAASLRGMDDGVSGRVDGLGALGNTLTPYIPELLGRAIMKAART